MKALRNTFSDASLHLLILAALAFGVGSWMVRDKPTQLDTDDVEIVCRYCGDTFQVKSIYGHLQTAHRAQVKADAAALANNITRKHDGGSRVGVIH